MSEPRSGVRYRRREDVLWRRVLDGVVLLAPNGEEPVHVDDPGALLWRGLAEPTTTSALAEELVTVYEVTVEQAERDITALLEHLLKLGVVEPEPKPTT